MKSLSSFTQVYLHRDPVDFRKSINGFGAIVQQEMDLNLFDPALFIFCCHRRKRIKILYWDQTGFALWYKKLEEDRFPSPRKFEDKTIELTTKELHWILEGIDIWKIKPFEEKKLSKDVLRITLALASREDSSKITSCFRMKNFSKKLSD
jgi:transposase